ncbi:MULTISPECIES: endopeptidase La [Aminobacterium]|uniref:Lon protease n=1 Tax=Aminobacterium colombiense (strain DSM 12261 / ALA-1) TaxID=572547 RepID=D5EEP5_AMICL|nr:MULTISPECIES: endopeptidase La [Aminobacterium]ADE57027.1 ATP-dependent protease La [Aminobacterium colombiense DSM 12261]
MTITESVQAERCYILPVRDLVLFPGVIVPLYIGRPRSLKTIEKASIEDKPLFVVAQKDLTTEEPMSEDIYTIGTLCKVLQMIRIPDGTVKILVEGKQRGRIREFFEDEETFQGNIAIVQWVSALPENMEALKRSVLELFEKYVSINAKIPKEVIVSLANIEHPCDIADVVASHLKIKTEKKQKLLSITNPEKYIKLLIKILMEEIELMELEQSIQEQVRQKMEKGHREYYLREQLKIIQTELGEEDFSSETENLLKKIAESEMPEEVCKKARIEVDRLSKMPPISSEASVLRTYLDWLLALPWNTYTEENLDITKAQRILDEDHYGLVKVKERILEFLAVRQLAGKEAKGQVLCFVGPPGVGKTSLAQSIARALGRRFVNFSLGGVRDEAEIRGHRRTYVGAQPGRIIQKMRQAGTKNPIMLMDEIDKIGQDFRGDPASALLEVLDPAQNSNFTDHYIESAFDLSNVIFITTANVTHTIPAPLLDRMEVIRLPGYVAEEKIHIAKKHLLPKLFKEHGLTDKMISITSKTVEKTIRDYTREAGVRNLQRSLATLCRKVTLKIVREGKDSTLKKITIGVKDLKDYLGAPRLYDVQLPQNKQKGTVVGLAWTESGGDVLVIEAVAMSGKGDIILTGNLGNIMQESAQTALGFLRARSAELGLDHINWKNQDIHIHVPEGAIPKDGPSAGITMAVVMLSALSSRQVLPGIAMTGEISLQGKVLPVGGIREKILAAKRQKISNIIIPGANRIDVEEMEQWVTKGLSFYFVDNVSEVFDIALERR